MEMGEHHCFLFGGGAQFAGRFLSCKVLVVKGAPATFGLLSRFHWPLCIPAPFKLSVFGRTLLCFLFQLVQNFPVFFCKGGLQNFLVLFSV